MIEIANGQTAFFRNSSYRVKFKFIPGLYNNFIEFLQECEIFFIAENSIDFTNIPSTLHGRGNSSNLLEYFANNSENVELIIEFLKYYIDILDFKYYLSGEKINYNFESSTNWQDSKFIIEGSYVTTTTTTSNVTTTTTTISGITTTTTTTTEPVTTTTTTTETVTTTTTTEAVTTTTTTESVTTTTTITEPVTTTTTTEPVTTTTTTEPVTTTTTTEPVTTTTTTIDITLNSYVVDDYIENYFI